MRKVGRCRSDVVQQSAVQAANTQETVVRKGGAGTVRVRREVRRYGAVSAARSPDAAASKKTYGTCSGHCGLEAVVLLCSVVLGGGSASACAEVEEVGGGRGEIRRYGLKVMRAWAGASRGAV